jgi:inosine-uridine nucleoside N-ribohydrolase
MPKHAVAIASALLLISFVAYGAALPIVIDTDMALDDVRAISLVLSSSRCDVRAIVSSDGASSPQAGHRNIRRILHFLGRDPIPVGVGITLNAAAPAWRPMSDAMGWCDENDVPEPSAEEIAVDAVGLIERTLRESEEKAIYLCLGPMTNIAEALKDDPSLCGRISAIHYYGSSPEAARPGWNTERDRAAAKYVFGLGIPIYAIHMAEDMLLTFDSALCADAAALGTPAARLITYAHTDSRVQRSVASGHLKAWDETIALYLHKPGLAKFRSTSTDAHVLEIVKWKRRAARRAYVRLLAESGMHD